MLTARRANHVEKSQNLNVIGKRRFRAKPSWPRTPAKARETPGHWRSIAKHGEVKSGALAGIERTTFAFEGQDNCYAGISIFSGLIRAVF